MVNRLLTWHPISTIHLLEDSNSSRFPGANPGTLSPAKLKVLREAGVNRVSIGAQGFDDALLKKLGRTHTCDDIAKTVAVARSGGIELINLDLIACIPGCTAAAWSNTLDRALELEPDHLSVYALSLDEGAALNRLAGLGRFGLLDAPASATVFYY